MSWPELVGPLAYAAVFIATVIEGEVVFVSAAILVQAGHLEAWPVYVAAALGGSVGDQLYFYALRGRPRRWIERFPTWRARRDRIVDRVKRNASLMILACRFLPGLRVAIPAACAFAGVSARRFTLLSIASSLGWAAAVMGTIAWLGPRTFAELGIRGWWTPIVPGVLVVGFCWWLARDGQTRHEDSAAA